MTLPHVLILSLSSLIGAVVLAWILHVTAGIDAGRGLWALLLPFVSIVPGVPLAWWISRLLRVPPLMIFAPDCPHCHQHPPGWWCLRQHKTSKTGMIERFDLACGLCDGRVTLWLRRRVAHPVSAEVPNYCLRWPEFLGIWRCLTVESTVDLTS
jgi:hypothetical protein